MDLDGYSLNQSEYIRVLLGKSVDLLAFSSWIDRFCSGVVCGGMTVCSPSHWGGQPSGVSGPRHSRDSSEYEMTPSGRMPRDRNASIKAARSLDHRPLPDRNLL